MSAADLRALAEQLSAIATTLRGLGPDATADTATSAGTPTVSHDRERLLARTREVERLRDHRRACFAEVAPLIHEPGFDVLLLVYRGSLEGAPVTVSMARAAAGAPESVGARWIDALGTADLLVRTYDPERVQMRLSLSPRGEAMMVRYLEALPF